MGTTRRNDFTSGMAKYSAIVLGALLLLIPAYYNHYPLVNPDTATYLASGFKPETPLDRPITYGLLLWLFSLNGLSLWLAVFAQALIVSWLVFSITAKLGGGKRYLLKGMIIMLLLSLSSSLSWVVCQVQPDIFTSIGMLCVILVLIGDSNKWVMLLLYVLFFITVAVHLSHPLLFAALVVCLFVARKYFFKTESYRQLNRRLVTLFILSTTSIALMGSALSKSSHVYIVGSLLEKGVLKKYLDDNCAVKNYKLCAYKDSLPLKSDDFIWVSTSPLYKAGDWKGSKPDFRDMIHGIFTSPKYLSIYLQASASQAMRQAMTNNIGDGNDAFPSGTNVHNRIAEYFPREVARFNGAAQNNRDLHNELIWPNRIFAIVIILSLCIIVYAFLRWKHMDNRVRTVFAVCITGIILNYLDIAAFSTVNGRYGCKMVWLLPFCAMVYLFNRQQVKRPVEN